MAKLKPCPNCGTQNPNGIFIEQKGKYLVYHTCKFGKVKSPAALDIDEAIELWNNYVDNISKYNEVTL